MAQSKTAMKKAEPKVDALTSKAPSGTPYKLDPTKVQRAANALVAHMKKHAAEKGEKAAVKNLADDEDETIENDHPIFLGVSTKKQINQTKSLKPTKMLVVEM
jgi:ribosome biogenesis protein UTP30